jgi:CheY-like chemotaxis protein
VVEDNLVNQRVVTAILKKKGYQIQIANHGEEALAALAAGPFSLVLMDVQMPVLDGLETTRRIRKDPSLRGLPIVAMTAHAMHGDRERCLQAGMNAYVSKPVHPGHLLATIEMNILARSDNDTQPSAPSEERAPIDERLAARLMDSDPDLINGMVRMFLQVAPERIHNLHSAAARADIAGLRQEVQKLRGAAERIAAVGVAEYARKIEDAAASADFAGITENLVALAGEVTRLNQHARNPTPVLTGGTNRH